MGRDKIKQILRYAIPFLAFIVIFGFALACGGSSHKLPKEAESITPETFKNLCEDVSYDELLRYPEKYEGSRIHVKGEVVQTLDSDQLHMNITKGSYGIWDDRTWLFLPDDSPSIIEEDIIEVWGYSDGIETYETVLRAKNKIPVILGKYVEMSELQKINIEKTEEAPEESEIIHETVQEYSRTSPAKIGDILVMEKDDWLIGKVKYEIELLEVISGGEAWEIVQKANMFNEEPGEGKEYILAKFRVKILETEGDEPFELNHAMFDVISTEGIEYTDFLSVSGLDPDLSADLYEGAEHVGWTYFLVNKQDTNPLAVIDRKSDSEIWFQLK